jgi:hypothetical protein
VRADGWTISEELFDLCETDRYPVLGDDAKQKMSEIIYEESAFSYLSVGFFFRSGGESIESRVARMWQAHGRIGMDHVAHNLFDNCLISDVRVRSELFGPENMTVFAYNDHGGLKKSESKEYLI